MKTLLKICIVTIFSSLLAACYSPSKIYWGHKINQLCAKEGGVKIYEKVALSKEEYDALPKNNGLVSVPIKELANENQGYYSEDKTIILNESNPNIRRVDTFIERKSDNKKIAQYTTFHRVGGDIPTGIGHPSSYTCPDPVRILEEISKVFYVRTDIK
jgi:hypothetical protein